MITIRYLNISRNIFEDLSGSDFSITYLFSLYFLLLFKKDAIGQVSSTLNIINSDLGFSKDTPNKEKLFKAFEELKARDMIKIIKLENKWNKELVIEIINLPESNYVQISPYNKKILNLDTKLDIKKLLSTYVYLNLKAKPEPYWKTQGYKKARIAGNTIAEAIDSTQASVSRYINKLEDIKLLGVFRKFNQSDNKFFNNYYYIYSWEARKTKANRNEDVKAEIDRHNLLKETLKQEESYPLLLIGEYADYLDEHLKFDTSQNYKEFYGDYKWIDDKKYQILDLNVDNLREKLSDFWLQKDTGRVFIFDLREKQDKNTEYLIIKFIEQLGAENPIIILNDYENLKQPLKSRMAITLKKIKSVWQDDFEFQNTTKSLEKLRYKENKSYSKRVQIISNNSPKLVTIAGKYRYDPNQLKQDKLISELSEGKTYKELKNLS